MGSVFCDEYLQCSYEVGFEFIFEVSNFRCYVDMTVFYREVNF